MLVQSIYTHVFQKDDKFFLYNSLVNLFAEITEELYEVIYNRQFDLLPEEICNDLIKKNVICEDVDKYSFYLGEKLKFYCELNNSQNANIVIVPTTDCNFDCHYCFEGKKRKYFMSESIQNSVIEFLKSSISAKNINLTWYGGEPLMAFNIMNSLYAKITTLTDKEIISHSIITNGYLINDRVIDFINTSNVTTIQVTLDGNRMRHDKIRCLRNSEQPTFDIILKNIGQVLKECPECKLNLRVNISNENSEDFFEIYRYALEIFKSDRLYVYPGFIREPVSDGCSLCYNSFTSYSRFRFYKNLQNKGANVKFKPRITKSRGCMMHQINSFIIGPQGELYKCWNHVNHKDKIIGNISGNAIENRSLFYHLLTETHSFTDPECKKCLIFPVCNGGCGAYRSLNIKEKGKFNLCPIYKEIPILEEMLLSSISKLDIKYSQKILAI